MFTLFKYLNNGNFLLVIYDILYNALIDKPHLKKVAYRC